MNRMTAFAIFAGAIKKCCFMLHVYLSLSPSTVSPSLSLSLHLSYQKLQPGSLAVISPVLCSSQLFSNDGWTAHLRPLSPAPHSVSLPLSQLSHLSPLGVSL